MAFTEKVGISDYAKAELKEKSKEKIEELRATRYNNDKKQRDRRQSEDETSDSNADSGSN